MNKKDSSRHYVNIIGEFLLSKSVFNIVAYDIGSFGGIADYALCATCTSARHVKNTSDNLNKFIKTSGMRKALVCGGENGDWIVMDFVRISVVVHLFRESVRKYYDIESLWRENGCDVVYIKESSDEQKIATIDRALSL